MHKPKVISKGKITGEFTAPRTGVYLVTFSYWSSHNAGKRSHVWLHKNGVKIEETGHGTYFTGEWGQVQSTGGRSVYLRLNYGNTISLQTETVTGGMYRIIFCVQFTHD